MRTRIPTLAAAVLLALAGASAFLWRQHVAALDEQIAKMRSSLKSLYLGGRLPPNPELMEYLTRRTEALAAQEERTLGQVAPSPPAIGEAEDPQLYFQQRLHEVQRTLERLTTARGLAAPVQLGFPKDLPPSESVPRFLLQAGLIEAAAELIMTVEGVASLHSFKVEDPSEVAAAELVTTTEASKDDGPSTRPSTRSGLAQDEGQSGEAFLTRLPVRIQLGCSLEALTRLLGLCDRARPVMDVEEVRMASPAEGAGPPGALQVELLVARYLARADTPARQAR